jgi:glycosyltransferase involved in cell wall biosynthesis
MIPGKVNVVIPVYNQEQFVAQCLRSVLLQTYSNFDITIVNDGSTDYTRAVIEEVIGDYTYKRTEREIAVVNDGETDADKAVLQEIIDAYAAKRAQIELVKGEGLVNLPQYARTNNYFPDRERISPTVIDQENKGLSESRNVGIRRGDGEFILPLDSDDWIEPNYLELAVPKMNDPKVGIVSPDMQYEGLLHERIPPRGLTLAEEMRDNNLPVCSLIRRAAFEQTSGYETVFVEVAGSTKVLGYEDWNMWIDILKRGWTVAVVNEPLFHYRVKPVSMITQARNLRPGLTRLIHLLHPDLWPEEKKS